MAKQEKKEKKKVFFENITPKEEILKRKGRALKAARKANGYSNSEHYGYQLDIGRTLFSGYEGSKDMKVSTLFRIIEGMGISVPEFFEKYF